MREHLYRAQRVGGKEWVYGDLVQLYDGRRFIIDNKLGACIDNKGNFINTEFPFVNEVIPETVCEYTGRDAYLKSEEIVPCKLFEGDICEVTVFDHNGIDTQHICKIEYLGGSFYFMGTDKYDFYLPLSDVDDTESDIEVIGTIFDEGEME